MQYHFEDILLNNVKFCRKIGRFERANGRRTAKSFYWPCAKAFRENNKINCLKMFKYV